MDIKQKIRQETIALVEEKYGKPFEEAILEEAAGVIDDVIVQLGEHDIEGEDLKEALLLQIEVYKKANLIIEQILNPTNEVMH